MSWTSNPWVNNPWIDNLWTDNPWTNAFAFEVKTTGASEDFVLPLESGGTYDFTVDWGDGASDDITVWNHADTTHTYASAGTYDVKITGVITGWGFNNSVSAPKVYEISSWGQFKILPASGHTFYGCSHMTWTGRAIGGFGTIGVTNMAHTFHNCSVFNQSVSNFNTDSVVFMTVMFGACYMFNQSLIHFNVANVTSMSWILSSTTLSTANYDALILVFSADVPSGAYSFHGGNAKYTAGGAVEAARDAWLAKGWSITDGGAA